VEDLLDAVPFVVLALLLGLATAVFTRRDDGSGRPRLRMARARVRSLVIVIGAMLLAPTVGIAVGAALSLSETAESRLAVGAEVLALVVGLLWRKLWLRRRIG